MERNIVDISIVIPCYPPHIKYLDNIFNDIIMQTLLPKEVILAVSETTDDSKNSIYQQFMPIFQSKGIEFKIVNKMNKQYAGINRNMGARLATSEYIMFIDADDNIHAQKIEITKYFIDKYKPNMLLHSYLLRASKKIFNSLKFDYTNAVIITNDTIFKDTFGNPPKRIRHREAKGYNTCIKIRSKILSNGPAHGYPTIKRSLLYEYQYSNLRRGQDGLFVKDILWNVGGVIYVNLALLNYNYVKKKVNIKVL